MYSATLQCGHEFTVRVVPPSIGDIVCCQVCHDYEMVNYRSTDYKVKCTECTYARITGADVRYARTIAGRHASRKQHTVKLFKMNTPRSWETINTGQRPLSLVDDIPPY